MVEPSAKTITYEEGDMILVLANEQVTSVLSEQALLRCIVQFIDDKSPEEYAQLAAQICTDAVELGSKQNATVICQYLHPPKQVWDKLKKCVDVVLEEKKQALEVALHELHKLLSIAKEYKKLETILQKTQRDFRISRGFLGRVNYGNYCGSKEEAVESLFRHIKDICEATGAENGVHLLVLLDAAENMFYF